MKLGARRFVCVHPGGAQAVQAQRVSSYLCRKKNLEQKNDFLPRNLDLSDHR